MALVKNLILNIILQGRMIKSIMVVYIISIKIIRFKDEYVKIYVLLPLYWSAKFFMKPISKTINFI